MRVKCPNSDIYLELPGDKMDMKFTCPACKKVHRVTISITTPGEVVPVAKVPPQMPKKYATGAYPPVVDIPIDADFVLFDSSGSQQFGIDLGQAAEAPQPPFVDRRMSERQTEIRRDSPQRAPSERVQSVPSEPPPEAPPAPRVDPVRDEFLKPADDASTQVALDDSQEFPASGGENEGVAKQAATDNAAAPRERGDNMINTINLAAPEPAKGFSVAPPAGFGSAAGKRRAKSRIPALIVLVLVAALAFLGWEQYLQTQNRQAIAERLARADQAASIGDPLDAGNAAVRAEELLASDKIFLSGENLWNRLAAEAAEFLPAIPNDDAAIETKIAGHLSRRNAFRNFQAELDANPPEEAAGVLTAGLANADAVADPGFVLAMRKAAVEKILALARSRNAASTPEETIQAAARLRIAIAPFLDEESAGVLSAGLEQAAQAQVEYFRQDVSRILADIDATAERGDAAAVERYLSLAERIDNLPASLLAHLGDGPEFLASALEPQWAHLAQVSGLAEVLVVARNAARTVLSLPEPDTDTVPKLVAMAEKINSPSQALADGAVILVEDTQLEAEKLMRLREDLFFKLQSENRRDKIQPGTMSAWRLLLASFGNPDLAIDPESFHYDGRRAEIAFTFAGVPLHVKIEENDYRETVRATALGYQLQANWAPFFHKPISWIADMAVQLRIGGVDPVAYPAWEVLEGPGGLLALTLDRSLAGTKALAALPPNDSARSVFYDGKVYRVEESSLSPEVYEHGERFVAAAKKLHEGIMDDESISQTLRQALKPVLMGTYLPIDPRDYFDAAFCRRLIEADYLESYIKPMPPQRQKELEEYRACLGKLEAGYDEFRVRLDSGDLLVAIAGTDQALDESKSGDQDAFSGELIPRYSWRVEKEETTVFHSPMPSRFNYALSLAEYYDGKVAVRPAGAPFATEVHHAGKGLLASYRHGDASAEGDESLWDQALASDIGGPLSPVYGPPGWNFPLHVLERNDQDDPLALASLDGVVFSPDFTGMSDPEQRRLAEDEWLAATAATFAKPGELGLIFHHFFRYCSDSPLPELPNLIGSHYGLSDTHQTVYQSLERRWVGRLIGDCDDLAEVFQVLTGSQGKLSYVMNLPAHAACGYVDKLEDGKRRFVVLQTGQVLQFEGETLNDVVEMAYRYFDRSAGESALTMDAVPLLLRFADEETRTPFVLSARIYEDREYADAMIRVQAYWHENTLSAAIEEMREMIKTDRDVGNIKELGSLYERVGLYEESAELRNQELEVVKDNPQATLSTLVELTQLYVQDRNKPEALKALHKMEEVMLKFTADNDVASFMRAFSFRSQWAIQLSRLGEPARAWNLVKYDVDFSRRQQGTLNDSVLRTLVVMYDKMALNRDSANRVFTDEERTTMETVGQELESAFARGVFQKDDDYTRTLMRYFFLGRYAVAREGRALGLSLLNQDGPYPDGPKDQTRRDREITGEDWSWMRIVPQLYMAYGMEMLDQEEFPELYDPQGARSVFEGVTRTVQKGAGLGSEVAGADEVLRADMTLSFINHDLQAFRDSMTVVKEKDYSKLYDDIAMTFGWNCGLIPLNEFDAWIEAFKDYFPGKQHYFKVVYRAIDKENYDHALKMAEATARFFPDEKLIVEEADFIRNLVPQLKARKAARPRQLNALPVQRDGMRPAA